MNIEDLKKLRDNLNEQIAELEAPKPAWEPEGGNFLVGLNGLVVHSPGHTDYRRAGIQRTTEEKAQKAAKEMRIFHRLLAYRDEFAPGFKTECGKEAYYIYFDEEDNKYGTSWDENDFDIGKIYMPEAVAEELCRKLNSGEVVL